MGHKKQSKVADRKAIAVQGEGHPFVPPSSTDPRGGSALIAPVTPDMMDHAAHVAAERADAVAHDAPEPVRPAADPAPPETMNHAAHAAAERADAVAQDAPEPFRRAADPAPPETIDHAAHVAAERADAVAPDVPYAAPDARRDAPDAEPNPAVAHGRSAAAGPIDGLSRYNAKVLEIAAANLSAAGAFVSALFAATSVSEAAAINAEHLRRRIDAMTTEGRDLMRLVQEVAFDAMRPPGDDRRDP